MVYYVRMEHVFKYVMQPVSVAMQLNKKMEKMHNN